MNKKHQVHNLIILDESGSMQSIKGFIMEACNELIQTMQEIEKQFPEQEHTVTFISFNGLGTKMPHFMEPVSTLQALDNNNYSPDAVTPLLDAMGFSIHKLRTALKDKTDYNVLVTILTDGEENASKEYNRNAIKKLVDELSDNNWTFTYIGTDHDVTRFARSISINNSMMYDKDEAGIKEMLFNESSSRHAFAQRIRNKENLKSGYFEKKDDPSKPEENK